MSYIKKVLMADEKVLYTTHLHPILFAPALVWCILGGFIFVFGRTLHVYLPIVTPFEFHSFLTYGCFLFSVLSAFNAYIVLQTSEYALTDKRVIMKIGWLSCISLDILLQKVESITIKQGLLGRFFNYGTVIICGTGGSKDPFYRIADPTAFRNRVQAQIERMISEND